MSLKSKISSFIKYHLSAKTIYNIHSPLVFEIITNCIADKRHYYAFDEIDYLRHHLSNSKEKIELHDLGAGSQQKKNTKFRTLAEILKYSSSSKRKGEILFKLANHYKINTALELGTNLGIGSAYIAKSNTQLVLHSLEGSQNLLAQARKHFKFLKLTNIKLYEGNFDKTLGDVLSKIEKLDLVYIDGNHREKETVDYYEKILPYLSNKAIIVMDDIHWSKGMEMAWSKILALKKHSYSIDMFNFSILIFGYSRMDNHDIKYIPYKYKPWKIGLFG